MLEKTRALVLRQTRYNDESMIVDAFTEGRGAVCFVVRCARGRRGARSMLLRPLNLLELDFDYRPNLRFQRIREMRVAVAYASLPYDPVKETVALFLSEFLYHCLRHEVRNEPLFEFLSQSMQWLDRDDRGTANFLPVFLIQLTRFLGFWPCVEGLGPLDVFDLREGVPTDCVPPHGWFLRREEAAVLPLLLRLRFGTMHVLRLNRAQRGRILELLIAYYRLHVAEFPELKSLEVLREVLS